MYDMLVKQALSLGISGLLFVMWWFERQERTRNMAGTQEALRRGHQIAEINEQLLDVIRANTEALAALREELRSHRARETEWLTRLTQRIDDL